jgi:hypothetical protein
MYIGVVVFDNIGQVDGIRTPYKKRYIARRKYKEVYFRQVVNRSLYAKPTNVGCSKKLKKSRKRYVVEHVEKRPNVKGKRFPTSGWPARIFESCERPVWTLFFLGRWGIYLESRHHNLSNGH